MLAARSLAWEATAANGRTGTNEMSCASPLSSLLSPLLHDSLLPIDAFHMYTLVCLDVCVYANRQSAEVFCLPKGYHYDYDEYYSFAYFNFVW